MRGTTVNTHLLTRLLQLDGVANAGAGLGLVLAAAWFAGPLGVGALPLRIAGLVFVAYGIENLLVARSITPRGLLGLAVVDGAFAVLALGFALSDPTAADTWARWTIAVVADLSLVMGVVKYAGMRRIQRAPAG